MTASLSRPAQNAWARGSRRTRRPAVAATTVPTIRPNAMTLARTLRPRERSGLAGAEAGNDVIEASA